LLAPTEVVLYLHNDLASTGFVDLLLCALQRVLVAPVYVKSIDLPLGPELRATSTQFDVGKVADRFIRATAAEGDAQTFKYLLLPYDLKSEPYHYVFATSFGGPGSSNHVGVVSTVRLDGGDPTTRQHTGADLTAERTYKLILKSIARVAGYVRPQGCILAFPRNLAELDAKPPEFCPEDRAALVDAGILKLEPKGGCVPIAAAPPVLQPIERRTPLG
jgi:predicted Zn-dependent protease